ncbi:unnamed protein product [Linum trigynum]
MATLLSEIKIAVVDELKSAMISKIQTAISYEIRSLLAEFRVDNGRRQEAEVATGRCLDQLELRVEQLEQRLSVAPVVRSEDKERKPNTCVVVPNLPSIHLEDRPSSEVGVKMVGGGISLPSIDLLTSREE